MSFVQTNKLPKYFYDIRDSRRWFDQFAADPWAGNEKAILSFDEMRTKYKRDRAYAKWLYRHRLRPKQIRFQRVRILRAQYAETGPKDWWPRFQDCVFTVFQQPETLYYGKQWLQFYVVCPDDCKLIARWLWEQKFGTVFDEQSGDGLNFITRDPRLNFAYVVPAKCCHHLRNETSAGKSDFAGFL